MSITTRETIGNNIKQKFIGHMKQNGVVIPTAKLGDYFAPTGRMKKRNINPQLGMVYEEDINLEAIAGNQIPDELTWISECEGNLVLKNNAFSTLEGCPEIVLGDLDISDNKGNLLLLGFPKQVGTDKYKSTINLFKSTITGLKYLPRVIHGSLLLGMCGLNSLEDCPQTIEGTFSIFGNYNITSLENGPKIVKHYYRCGDTSVENFIHAPTNPDFYGFMMPATINTAVYEYRYVQSWAGFKPAMNDSSTATLIEYVQGMYGQYSKNPNPAALVSDEAKFCIKLGAYLEMRKSKPELDTSVEAREEFAAYNPTSLEDLKAKSDTKEYEGIDINYVKMLKKALLK